MGCGFRFTVNAIVLFVGILSCCNISSAQIAAFIYTIDVKHKPSSSDVRLRDGLPVGVEASVLLRDTGLREDQIAYFGSFTFGDVRSTSVCVALSTEPTPRLFVDLDRNRKLTSNELIASNDSSSGGPWALDLVPELTDGNGTTPPASNRLELRFDSEARHMIQLSAGCMKGETEFAGEPIKAIKLDRDANGLWNDAADRLLLDLNGDGRFDPIIERFSTAGIQTIRGRLVAIGLDKQGLRLDIREIREKGFLKPTLALNDTSAKIEMLEVEIESQAGILFRATLEQKEIEVPVGEYHIKSLRTTVRGESGCFQFVFLRSGDGGDPVRVDPDSTKEIELLGDLELASSLDSVKSGTDRSLLLMPSFNSQSGLYLAGSKFGDSAAVNENLLRVECVERGRSIGGGTSGFS
jgi:hypothetical protein